MAQWQLMAGDAPVAGQPLFDDGGAAEPGDPAFTTDAVKAAVAAAGATGFNYVGPSAISQDDSQ